MEPSSRPLYMVCTRKEVCNLLNRILCRKHVAARRGDKREQDLIRVSTGVKWFGIRLACINNTSLPPFMSPHDHVNSYQKSHQVSKLTCISFACNITLTAIHVNMPCNNYSGKHAKHSSYQRFKHACLVRSSRSLARRSLRFRHLLRYLRYKEIAC